MKLLIQMILIAGLCMASLSARADVDYNDLPPWFQTDIQTLDKALDVPMLTNGYRLCVTLPNAIPAFTTRCLLIVKGRERKPVFDIWSLKGYVRIHTSEEALKYVRLRTSLQTWLLWPESNRVFTEIISRPNVALLPNYGLKDNYVKNLMQYWHSGDFAVLSPDAFRLGHFKPPSVKHVGHLYIIDRWIAKPKLTTKPGTCIIQEILETVTDEGDYTWKVLVSRDTPNLPDTTWMLPSFL